MMDRPAQDVFTTTFKEGAFTHKLIKKIGRFHVHEQVLFLPPVLLLAGLIGIGCPEQWFEAFKISAIPAIAMFIQAPWIGVVFDICHKITADHVTALIEKIEATKEQCAEAKHWRQMIADHQDMDSHIENMWALRVSPGGRLLSHMIRPYVATIFLSLVFASFAEKAHLRGCCIISAMACGLLILRRLWPLARITSSCTSRYGGKRSIVKVANSFFGRPEMSQEAAVQHSLFVQYLSSEPAGVEVPWLGMMTTTGMIQLWRYYGGIFAAVLGYTLHALHSLHLIAEKTDPYSKNSTLI